MNIFCFVYKNIDMDLSEAIRKIREEKRIRQIQAADFLNMEQPSYAYLEKRGEKLTIEQLRKIAEALGVTIDDILNYGKERNTTSNQEVSQLKEKISEQEALIRHLRVISEGNTRAANDTKFTLWLHDLFTDFLMKKHRINITENDFASVLSEFITYTREQLDRPENARFKERETELHNQAAAVVSSHLTI